MAITGGTKRVSSNNFKPICRSPLSNQYTLSLSSYHS